MGIEVGPASTMTGMDEMPLALTSCRKSPRAAPLRVMAVTSGKGGVGKSNVVANLGLALSRRGLKVLLIDADLGLGNLDILLGLNPRFTIQDALSLRLKLAEVLVAGPGGLRILPASSGIPELVVLNKLQKLFLLSELDHCTADADVVLIDTGAGISPNVLFFNLAAQERLLVVNDQPPALADAYALIKVLVTRHDEKHFKLLVNDLTHPQEGEFVYHALVRMTERFLGQGVTLDYLGFIPHDDAVPQAVRKQQPVLALYPQAPASRSFVKIARTLWQSTPPGADGNIKFFSRGLLCSPPEL
ncbi:MAG TPA: MinD/ParA family protein [Desulfobaccales bacterium]|nr:MinD/ParA family protein [Desulfobaccales bacterium]